jgi:hypothetical protein
VDIHIGHAEIRPGAEDIYLEKMCVKLVLVDVEMDKFT